MKTFETSTLQIEYGIRWMVAALLIFAAMGSAHAAERKSANATLTINVTIMPIVQAQTLLGNNEKPVNATNVAYSLQPAVVKQSHEVRTMPVNAKVQTSVAVLDTATYIAD